MRMALVHDYLTGKGGAERVFQYMCEEFSEADIYTLAYAEDQVYSYFKTRKINTTWLNPFLNSMESVRWSFPIATHTMERLDLSQYDIVLSSSASMAKYVQPKKGIHICYCFIPTRALWHFDKYFGKSTKAKIVRPLLNHLRKRDYAAAQKVDYFLTISNDSQQFIKQYYDRESEVIYSPIETTKFRPSKNRGNHYLIISRLERWKRVEYAIEAFNQLGLPLRIIGTGQEEETLRAMAQSNITFLGVVDDDTLVREYGEAKAVVFTPELEYGLIPIEANASGTPVICLGKAGVRETMIPANEPGHSEDSWTSVFFYHQTAEDLIKAIEYFEITPFKPERLIQHASKWSVDEFKVRMREAVNRLTKQN
ncbi:glycosyltransferase [Deltaproteobacteria bacterium TL4]